LETKGTEKTGGMKLPNKGFTKTEKKRRKMKDGPPWSKTGGTLKGQKSLCEKGQKGRGDQFWGFFADKKPYLEVAKWAGPEPQGVSRKR